MRVSLTFHRTDGSISVRPLLDNDRTYLPDGRTYVTTTKSGKPVLARKKRDKVLQDHGFDVLGQGFGLPSRVDFEHGRPVPSHITAATAPVRPARCTPVPRLIEIDSEEEEAIMAARARRMKDDEARSWSRPTNNPRSILRRAGLTELQPLEDDTSYPMPESKYRTSFFSRDTSQIRSPSRGRSYTRKPTERRRFAVRNSDSSSPSEYHSLGTYSIPLNSPQLPPHIGTAGKVVAPDQNSCMIWSPVGTNYVTPGVANDCPSGKLHAQHTAHQAGSYLPTFAHGIPQAQPNIQHMAAAHPAAFMPPPPPPPPGFTTASQGFHVGGDGSKRTDAQEEERIKEHFESVVKPTLAPDGKHQENKESGDNGKLKKTEKHQTRSETKASKVNQSTATKQKHVCVGCGSTRSRHYHMTHPLKRGEMPEPDYCRRCVAAAECTDSDDTDSLDSRNHLTVRTPLTTLEVLSADLPKLYHLEVPSSGKDCRVSSDKSRQYKRRPSRITNAKPKKRGFLKVMTSAMTSAMSPKRHQRISSLSTPEDSSSRASPRPTKVGANRLHSPSSEPRLQSGKRRSPLCQPIAETSRTVPRSSQDSPRANSPSAMLYDQEGQGETSLTLDSLPRGSREVSRSGSRIESRRGKEGKAMGSHTKSAAPGSKSHSKASSRHRSSHKHSYSVLNFSSKISSKASVKSSSHRENVSIRYEKPTVRNETSDTGYNHQDLGAGNRTRGRNRPVSSTIEAESVSSGSRKSGSLKKNDKPSPSSTQVKPVPSEKGTPSNASSQKSGNSRHTCSESDLLGESACFGRPGVFDTAPNLDDVMDTTHNPAPPNATCAANAFCS